AVGALYGTAGSREDHELEGAVIGAGLGVGLPLGIQVAGKIVKGIRKMFGKNEKLDPDVVEYLKVNEQKFDELSDKLEKEVAESEEIIKRELLKESPDFTAEEAQKIVQEQAQGRQLNFSSMDEMIETAK